MNEQEFNERVAEALALRNEGKHAEALESLKGIAHEATGIQVGEVIHHMGTTLQGAKRFPEAIGMLDAARMVREHMGDVIGVAFTQFQLAMCSWMQLGQDPARVPLSAFRVAVPRLEAALQAEPSRKQEGDLRQNLAFCRQMTGDFAGALEDYKDVLKIRRAIDDERGEGLTLLRIGECKVALGDHDAALQAAEYAGSIFNPDVIHDKNRMKQLEELRTSINAMPVS